MYLKDKILGCWCEVKDDKKYYCHTQILRLLINNADNLLEKGIIKNK